ncbi:MAG: hypothetical protein HQM16_02235 [Deltaproteobacteria bacterium]|nr:hypothetical protein [Deltaproteobacteria bacterium]
MFITEAASGSACAVNTLALAAPFYTQTPARLSRRATFFTTDYVADLVTTTADSSARTARALYKTLFTSMTQAGVPFIPDRGPETVINTQLGKGASDLSATVRFMKGVSDQQKKAKEALASVCLSDAVSILMYLNRYPETAFNMQRLHLVAGVYFFLTHAFVKTDETTSPVNANMEIFSGIMACLVKECESYLNPNNIKAAQIPDFIITRAAFQKALYLTMSAWIALKRPDESAVIAATLEAEDAWKTVRNLSGATTLGQQHLSEMARTHLLSLAMIKGLANAIASDS